MEVTSGAWVKVGSAPSGPILALDTSTDRAAVALALADGEILVAPTGSSRQHGRGLLAAIHDLLLQGNIRPQELTAIGVGLGPGSFTGLRIGLTAAKTLAYAVGCPLYALDSLEAIARNAPDDALAVIAVGDAQRGDVFFAEFTRDMPSGVLRRTGPNQLAPAVELAAGGVAASTFVLGPPLGRSEPTWTAMRGDLSTAYPDGRCLIELTRERIASGDPDEPYFLEPIYARRSAAEEKAAPGLSPSFVLPSPSVGEDLPRNTDGLPA